MCAANKQVDAGKITGSNISLVSHMNLNSVTHSFSSFNEKSGKGCVKLRQLLERQSVLKAHQATVLHLK